MNNLEILILTVSVISVFVFGVPLLFGILLPIIKPTISKKTNRYLYAFSSGFFLVMATVLFIGESRTHLLSHFNEITGNNEPQSQAIVASIISGTVLVGLLISIGMKYLFAKTKSETEIETHNHDKMIFNITDYNPKSKAFAIFFLLSHRIPDGLIIGLLSTQIAKEGVSVVNIIFLCSFVIHVIPEELIIYYRQIDMGISRKKAMLNSLLAVSLIIPLIIVGAAISWFSIQNEVAIHVIQLIAASFLLFISIVEFLPEFLHDIKISGKSWYVTILIFIIGVTVGLFILCFHNHEVHHEHIHFSNLAYSMI